ncbi:MAG: flagellar basal body rod protein FlgC [Planctomycetes bacterium]|nr:flagellar basal body rod protein FlgC [Planctomycetota bacterium]
MGLFTPIDIAASALRAERLRMNVIANNLANLETTRGPDGRLMPYVRKLSVFRAGASDITGNSRFGVTLAEVMESGEQFRRVWDPYHPDAVKAEDVERAPEMFKESDIGFVLYPNVDMPTEIVDMTEATRIYQANISVVGLTRAMVRSSLEILA